MVITTSEHLLSIDDNILAICLIDSRFNIIETASRQFFERRFAISEKLKNGASAFAATIFGMAQLIDETFGETKSILVDHGMAKTMLIHIPERGFVGTVLNTSANADYIALKITSRLESEKDIEHYV